jgi:uncharacterized protein (TIGR03435 family)
MPQHLKRYAFILLATSMLVLTVPTARAQTAPLAASAPQTADAAAKALAFDVISIRPNKDNAQMSGNGTFRMRFGIGNPPDGYSATNVTLKNLIASAYGVKYNLISGGPDWIAFTGYNIEAKVVAADPASFHPLTSTQRNLMLRSLLADRFKLVVHPETKELPIYELVIAKNGPKLQETKPGDTTNGLSAGMITMRPGQFTGHALPLTSLIDNLAMQLHSPVVDKTGLTGKYDIKLEWTRDQDPASEDASGPSIFTALQEQLGLKLNSTKGPVDTLVIDHIEKPSEN